MSSGRRQEIAANLLRAEDSLRASRILIVEELYDSAASRAYYTAFHAATALLLHRGLEYGKHSGVIAAIHKNFVRTGELSAVHGKAISWLFNLRNVGDSGETNHVSHDDAHRAVHAAGAFLDEVKSLLTRPSSGPISTRSRDEQ